MDWLKKMSWVKQKPQEDKQSALELMLNPDTENSWCNHTGPHVRLTNEGTETKYSSKREKGHSDTWKPSIVFMLMYWGKAMIHNSHCYWLQRCLRLRTPYRTCDSKIFSFLESHTSLPEIAYVSLLSFNQRNLTKTNL